MPGADLCRNIGWSVLLPHDSGVPKTQREAGNHKLLL